MFLPWAFLLPRLYHSTKQGMISVCSNSLPSPRQVKCSTKVVRMCVHSWVPAMDDGWSPPYLPIYSQELVQGSATFIGKVSHNRCFRLCKLYNLYFSYLTLTREGLEHLRAICKWVGMAGFQLIFIHRKGQWMKRPQFYWITRESLEKCTISWTTLYWHIPNMWRNPNTTWNLLDSASVGRMLAQHPVHQLLKRWGPSPTGFFIMQILGFSFELKQLTIK